MEQVTLFVPYIAPSTNAMYSGQHWAKRKKHKEAALKAVNAALSGKEIPQFKTKVWIWIRPYLGKGRRSYDVSNYSYTLKLIEDCLVSRGVLKDDTIDCVDEICISAPQRTSGQTGVEVNISEL